MNQLLVLNTPPELEDDMVDYLLTVTPTGGFTSYPVHGHGEQRRLSIAEQVAGRRKRVQFELILAEEGVTDLLAGIGTQVGNDIFYWRQSIASSGRI